MSEEKSSSPFPNKGLKNVLRTKKQRTDSYLKKQGAVSGVFENDMTTVLIKGILKKKKAYVSYLTNDRILEELINLLLCKNITDTMALNCHEAYSVLSSRGALPCLKIIADPKKPFLDSLWAYLPGEGDPLTLHPGLTEDQMPNIFWYWANTMRVLNEQVLEQMIDYIVSKNQEIENKIFAHLHQYCISIFVSPLLAPSHNIIHTKWVQAFLPNLFKHFAENPTKHIMSLSRIISGMNRKDSGSLDTYFLVMSTLLDHLPNVFTTILEPSTNCDGTIALEKLLEYVMAGDKGLSLSNTVYKKIYSCHAQIKELIESPSAAVSYSGLLIVYHQLMHHQLELVNKTLSSILKAILKYPNRSMFLYCARGFLLYIFKNMYNLVPVSNVRGSILGKHKFFETCLSAIQSEKISKQSDLVAHLREILPALSEADRELCPEIENLEKEIALHLVRQKKDSTFAISDDLIKQKSQTSGGEAVYDTTYCVSQHILHPFIQPQPNPVMPITIGSSSKDSLTNSKGLLKSGSKSNLAGSSGKKSK